MKLNKFFTSGFDFTQEEVEQKNRYQLVNIILLLSIFSGALGGTINLFIGAKLYMVLDYLILLVSIVMLYALRVKQSYFFFVSTTLLSIFALFFVFTIYSSEASDMKHVWLFTYPLILFSIEKPKVGIMTIFITVFLVLLAPIQPFIEVQYTFIQTLYVAVVMIVISVVTYYYQQKISEAKDAILQQQHILNAQSRQAVMGEMLSMIAHQWRQPLSTITLQISELQLKRLMGQEIKDEDIDKTLENINNSIIYLSDTVDDFKTYFRTNKESVKTDIYRLLKKAVSFMDARIKGTNIDIIIEEENKIYSEVYPNELTQVLLNILNNAVDVLLEVKNDTSEIRLSVKDEDERLLIYIKDTGTGVSKENVDYIFEPYFSTKGKNGTGLGLYMSQMIVQKQFNGNINVVTSDSGATFIVEISKKIAG